MRSIYCLQLLFFSSAASSDRLHFPGSQPRSGNRHFPGVTGKSCLMSLSVFIIAAAYLAYAYFRVQAYREEQVKPAFAAGARYSPLVKVTLT